MNTENINSTDLQKICDSIDNTESEKFELLARLIEFVNVNKFIAATNNMLIECKKYYTINMDNYDKYYAKFESKICYVLNKIINIALVVFILLLIGAFITYINDYSDWQFLVNALFYSLAPCAIIAYFTILFAVKSNHRIDEVKKFLIYKCKDDTYTVLYSLGSNKDNVIRFSISHDTVYNMIFTNKYIVINFKSDLKEQGVSDERIELIKNKGKFYSDERKQLFIPRSFSKNLEDDFVTFIKEG